MEEEIRNRKTKGHKMRPITENGSENTLENSRHRLGENIDG